MQFIVRVYDLGLDVNTLENGDVSIKVLAFLSYVASTAFSNQTQCYIDPALSDDDIYTAIANAVRESAQENGVAVPDNAPVLILGGVVRV